MRPIDNFVQIAIFKSLSLKEKLFFLEYKMDEIDYNIEKIQFKINNLKKYLNKQTEKTNEKGNNINKSIIKKKEREPRHFAPANKEWKNSIYTFNKNNYLDMANRDKITSNFIKSYFNMVPEPFVISKSKRMRDLIRRSSTKQLFVSEPEIKQTNDKTIITVFSFDREKRLLHRKLFFLRKWLNVNLMSKNFKLKRSKNKFITKLKIKKVNFNLLYKKHIIYNKLLTYRKRDNIFRIKRSKYNKRLSFRKTRNILKRKISKYNTKKDLSIKTINILLKKKNYFINVFIFKFIKRIFFSFFGKTLLFIPNRNNLGNKGKKYVDLVIKSKDKIKFNEPDLKLKFKTHLNLRLLRSINIWLFNYVLNKSNKEHSKKYILIFNKLKHKYEELLRQNYLRKEMLIIKYLSNLYINKFKYYNYLPGLKNILSKIYNKKIQFNLVKLRNIHLNSDMFSEAISVRVRKRTRNVTRILKKSFNLIKKIKPNSRYITIQRLKNFTPEETKTYFGKYNVINASVINKVFNDMYSNNSLTTIKGILKNVKYKWITGARIETKGRLTKRYAAARALFKYKYRGTLRNLELLKHRENSLQSPSVFMLRGDNKPNTQYTLIHSKRRIGAFGIKGWISNS